MLPPPQPAPQRPDEGKLSDEAIVRRVQSGESALFEILMRRYNQRLYRVARAVVKDEAEAEDVMQQAYVNAYTHLEQFADRARFSTWLTRIALHEALARARRRSRFTEIPHMSDQADGAVAGQTPEDSLTAPGPDPEQQLSRGELRQALETALATLPPLYRTTFVLRDVDELSTAEAAECLGVSVDTVKTRLHRARALLRDALFERAGLAARDAFPFPAPRCDRMVGAVFAQLQEKGLLTVH
jgi:RNA polymerase sigma-70 factor, ECF subfamily